MLLLIFIPTNANKTNNIFSYHFKTVYDKNDVQLNILVYYLYPLVW